MCGSKAAPPAPKSVQSNAEVEYNNGGFHAFNLHLPTTGFSVASCVFLAALGTLAFIGWRKYCRNDGNELPSVRYSRSSRRSAAATAAAQPYALPPDDDFVEMIRNAQQQRQITRIKNLNYQYPFASMPPLPQRITYEPLPASQRIAEVEVTPQPSPPVSRPQQQQQQRTSGLTTVPRSLLDQPSQ